MLTRGEVEEFKKLVLDVYGKDLTDEEAEDQGSRLIHLYEEMLRNKTPIADG